MRALIHIAFAFTALIATSLVAAQNPDNDNDGVPDSIEAALGLNPAIKDNAVGARSRLFAMQQYRDFLGREGESDGIAFYENAIDGGQMSRASAIEAFLGSPEFQNGLPQCTRLYFSFFNRIPDYGGLMFQIAQFRGGATLAAISENFSNSPEFTNRYGSLSNEQYINLVYQNVLGCAPDADGFNFYRERLGDGRLTRGEMMVGFSESPEFQELVVNEVYVTAVYVGMLRRAPDAAGMQFYLDQIEGGMPRNRIVEGFMGSPEYRNRFMPPPPSSNQAGSQKLIGGMWTFEFTLGSLVRETYSFTSLKPPNSSGDYVALGTDAQNDDVAGGYFTDIGQWAVLGTFPEGLAEWLYTFSFTDDNRVVGCYFEINPPGSSDIGTCYPMTGVRSP